jgi:hypothetical protein
MSGTDTNTGVDLAEQVVRGLEGDRRDHVRAGEIAGLTGPSDTAMRVAAQGQRSKEVSPR